ncbi:MAG: cadherin-like domain-containing protein [Pirellulaceae bacterium]
MVAQNDLPIAAPDHWTIHEDQPLNGNVVNNDIDPDGASQILTVELVENVTHGQLTLQIDGTFVYIPTTNYDGGDEFAYRLFDGIGYSDVVTASIDVLPVNDAPVAVAESVQMLASDTLVVTASNGLLANDSDVENDSLSAVLISGPSSGALTLRPDGSWQYVPASGFFGTVSFAYAASDGLLLSSPVNVTIVVNVGNVSDPDISDESVNDDLIDDVPDDSSLAEEDDSENETEDQQEDEAGPAESFVAEPDARLSATASDASSQEGKAGKQGGAVATQLLPTSVLTKQDPSEKDAADRMFDMSIGLHLNLLDPLSSTDGFNPYTAEEMGRLQFKFDTQAVQFAMDQFQQMSHEQEQAYRFLSGAATSVFVGTTAGLAVWSISGSYLLSIVASSLPVWARLDPIHVVHDPTRKRTPDDDMSVADIISSQHQAELRENVE